MAIVKLVCSDGKVIEEDMEVMKIAQVVKDITDDFGDDFMISVDYDYDVIEKVIQYCKHHYKDQKTEWDVEDLDSNNISDWDAQFADFDAMGNKLFFAILKAANFLGIKGLFDLTSKVVANRIKKRIMEYPRDMVTFCDKLNSDYSIVNDFSSQEIQNIVTEIEWTYDA